MPQTKAGAGHTTRRATTRPSNTVASRALRADATLTPASAEERAQAALEWLRRHASRAMRDGLARFAIPSDHALGVSMKDIQALAKQLGRDHDLAAALWGTGVYEARMLASYVEQPERVSAAQMDRWCRDFDNWAICDTLCFVLFDRTEHAWRKVEQWSAKRGEFQKRAAFALLASLALHSRLDDEGKYAKGLELIEREAGDERNFVRKGLSWALRAIGRRSAWHAPSVTLAERLAASSVATERWLGKDALRDLRKVRLLRESGAGKAGKGRSNGK